ncbi:MAG: hypothetical protein U0522_02175 [Candidatus Paceibacterota bacterium]
MCPSTPKTFKDVICIFLDLFSLIIPLLAGLALLAFFWGLAKFIYNAGSESAREDAKNVMFWGIIGLFVMFSIWGIVSFFTQDFFGVSFTGLPRLPVFQN